jgi:dihydroxyacetone kinase-like protein
MQKFVNDQNNMVDESIIVLSMHPDIVAQTDCPRTLKYIKAPVAGKVGVVSGGGWGHEPAFMGYSAKTCGRRRHWQHLHPAFGGIVLRGLPGRGRGQGRRVPLRQLPEGHCKREKAVGIVAAEGIRVISIISNDDIATNDPRTRRVPPARYSFGRSAARGGARV